MRIQAIVLRAEEEITVQGADDKIGLTHPGAS